MSANETIHVSNTGGQKAGNLDRYDLLPATPLRRLAHHFASVPPGTGGNFNALNDHIWSFWEGNERHPQTDYVNLMAAARHALMLTSADGRPQLRDARHEGDRRGFDLIPAQPLRQLAHHFGVGSLKYDDDNWRKGYDWRLSFAALNRHLWLWWSGEEIDAETGSPHLIAVAWHCLILDEFTRIHPQFDTRTSTKVTRWLKAERRHRNEKCLAVLEGARDTLKSIGVDVPTVDVAEHVRYARGGISGNMNINVKNAHATKLRSDDAPAAARVIDTIGPEHKGSDWTTAGGVRARWITDHHGDGYSYLFPNEKPASTLRFRTLAVCGPFTETPRTPRIVQSLGDTERDAEWTDHASGNYT